MQAFITGHRPQLIGKGWRDYAAHRTVRMLIRGALEQLKPDLLYTGMALGADLWAAQAALNLNIPYVAAIPFKNQHITWSPECQQDYHRLLNKASSVTEVDRVMEYTQLGIPYGTYHKDKMLARNRWLVDHMQPEDILLAVWDGRKSGGTAHCLRYWCQSHHVRTLRNFILRINPITLTKHEHMYLEEVDKFLV